MPQYINQISSRKEEVGGMIPVYINAPLTRVGSGLLGNKLKYMEKLSVGSPFEYNYKTRVSKILKCFEVKETSTSDTNTIITLKRTFLTPMLYPGMNLMVEPSTINGTGKAVTITSVDESKSNEYKITVPTADIDAVSKGKFLVEAEGSGSGKKMFCIPDNLTIKDTIGGDQNLLGVPYTRKYLYENCIPAMPKIVKDNIKDVVWERIDENNE